jgi:hypothetical protein
MDTGMAIIVVTIRATIMDMLPDMPMVNIILIIFIKTGVPG